MAQSGGIDLNSTGWQAVPGPRQLAALIGRIVKLDVGRLVTGLVVGEDLEDAPGDAPDYYAVRVLLALTGGQQADGVARAGSPDFERGQVRVRVLPFHEAARLKLSFGTPNPYLAEAPPLDPENPGWQTVRTALQLESLGGRMVEFDGGSECRGVALLTPGLDAFGTGSVYITGTRALGPDGYGEGYVVLGDQHIQHEGLRVRVLPPEEAAGHRLSFGERNPFAPAAPADDGAAS